MPTKSSKISSIKSESSIHPYHFYREENPDLPLRESPPINNHYQPIFSNIRKHMLTPMGYKIKESLEEFKPHSNRIAQWNDIIWQGDMLGDKLARMFKDLKPGQGRKLFEQVLEEGIESIKDPHPALVELSEHMNSIPKLFDMNKVKRGSEILSDTSLFSYYLAMFSQLGIGSNFGPVGRMVGASGRFFNVRKSVNRLVETIKYVVADMNSEDLFQAGSESLKDAYRVKLMHGLVRAHAMNSDDKEVYDFENRGNPINMRDSMGGAFVFGITPLAMDNALGGNRKAVEFECIAEIGNIIAYINGTDYELLPKSLDEHALFYDWMFGTYEGLGPYAEKLNQATYIDTPKAIEEGQNSWFAKQAVNLAGTILSSLMIWSYGKDLCEKAGGIDTSFKAQIGTIVFPIYKYGRKIFDALDSFLPGSEGRKLKRRAFHKKFHNEIILDFIMKSLDQSVDLKFDGHDASTDKDMSNSAA